MCGIVGGILHESEGHALQAALTTIAHRGPDDEGRFRDGPLCLGSRRLAIIDLAGGRQPMTNEDGSIIVVFNGEIYNYKELMADLRNRGHHFQSSSDTEVLAHLYEEHGTELCQYLRGMFVFAIWDKRRQELFVARDRFGKKPLYYVHDDRRGFVFASELKALRPLMAEAGIPCDIRDQGVYDYLSLGVVPQPMTIYHNIKALMPGHWLVHRDGRIRTSCYWQWRNRRSGHVSYDEAKHCVRTLIRDAVRLRLRSDVPLGVFLSGGIDSSVVAYEAAQELGARIQGFTISMNDGDFDEASLAKQTAEQLGIRHEVLRCRILPKEELAELVQHFDQPFADSSAIPSVAVARLARQYVKVVLNGDGGDEVFAGYRRYAAARMTPLAGVIPHFVANRLSRLCLQHSRGRRRSALGFASRFFRGLTQRPGARYLTWTTDMLLDGEKASVWRQGAMISTEQWLEHVMLAEPSALKTQLGADIRINLLSDLLVKMDMATMAASVEARSPFLDHTIAEFTASLPDHYLVSGNRQKVILRDAYATVLPEGVIAGRKRGFEIPLRSWLRNELKPLVYDSLGNRGARVRQYLDDDFVDGLLEYSPSHEKSWETMLYALLVLELWLRGVADDALRGNTRGKSHAA